MGWLADGRPVADRLSVVDVWAYTRGETVIQHAFMQ
jgi:hypothetical protein